jgi:hypothetical protein
MVISVVTRGPIGERSLGRWTIGLFVAFGLFLWWFPEEFNNAGTVRDLVVTILIGAASIVFACLAVLHMSGMRLVWSLGQGQRTIAIRWETADRDSLAGEQARRAPLTSFQLTDVYLPEAPLMGADLNATDLTNAVLREADLSSASIRRSNLRGTDLRGSDIRMASLRHSDLTGASLRHARLDGADLTGADLTGADLTGADLSLAVYDSETTWPLQALPKKLGAINIDDVRT